MSEKLIETLWVCGGLIGATIVLVAVAYYFWYPRVPEESSD